MTEMKYEGRKTQELRENEPLLNLTDGGIVYGKTRTILCKIGLHGNDAVYVWWNLETTQTDGSKAAFISKCKCGKERLLLPNQVPTYLRQRITKTQT